MAQLYASGYDLSRYRIFHVLTVTCDGNLDIQEDKTMAKPFTGERRDERLVSLLTAPEKRRVAAAAFAAGETVSDYVRRLALREARGETA